MLFSTISTTHRYNASRRTRVPAGASNPAQNPRVRRGKPASVIVGKSGKLGLRVSR